MKKNTNQTTNAVATATESLPNVYLGNVLYGQNETCVVYIEANRRKEAVVYSIDRSGGKVELYPCFTFKTTEKIAAPEAAQLLSKQTEKELARRKQRDTLRDKVLEHNQSISGAVRSIKEKMTQAVREAWACGTALNQLHKKMLYGEWNQYCAQNIPLSAQTIRRYRKLTTLFLTAEDVVGVTSISDAYRRAGLLPEPQRSYGTATDPEAVERLQLYQTGKLKLELAKNSGSNNKMVKLAKEYRDDPKFSATFAGFTEAENHAVKYEIGEVVLMLVFHLKEATRLGKEDIARKALEPVFAWFESNKPTENRLAEIGNRIGNVGINLNRVVEIAA